MHPKASIAVPCLPTMKQGCFLNWLDRIVCVADRAGVKHAMCCWLVGCLLFTSAPASQVGTIPYVPTRHDVVRDLLWIAGVGTNDVVYDLGSGDGRVVIAAVRDFHARKAVGIEKESKLVEESRTNAGRASVADRAEFLHGDIFARDFSEANVVVLYLGHEPNLNLRAKLVGTLKPGARIVSHQFGMGEWPADKKLEVRMKHLGMYSEQFNTFATNSEVPDFRTPFAMMHHQSISMWVVPARVAGVWRGMVATGSGIANLRINVHQRLSRVTGTFEFKGASDTQGSVVADLWGDHVRFHCISTNVPFGSFIQFDGKADGDRMTGTLSISRGGSASEVKWTGHREKADLIGTWQWPGPKQTPVRLRIERRDGRLAATYLDASRVDYRQRPELPSAVDFYEFGGGFYFTLLLGQQADGGRRMGVEDGWLVGEALAINDKLEGTIAFYPYPQDMFPRVVNERQPQPARPILETGPRDWGAKRLPP